MANATIGTVSGSKKTGALDATHGEKTICNSGGLPSRVQELLSQLTSWWGIPGN